MLPSKAAILASLALLDLASSQVIVTVTSTVTLITVTVPPLTTSTSTVIVTVNAPSPTTKSTFTKTVTVTAGMQTATAASCPIAQWGQCGGRNYQVPCGGGCVGGSACVYDSEWWSYCSPLPQLAVATSTFWAGWHGIYASAA